MPGLSLLSRDTGLSLEPDADNACPRSSHMPARHLPRFARGRAVGADEAIRPAKPPDIRTARRFAAKPRVELLKRSRVINPSDRMSRAFDPQRYHWRQLVCRGYPLSRKMWTCEPIHTPW